METEVVETNVVKKEKKERKKLINLSIKQRKIIFIILSVICLSAFGFAITPKTMQNDTYYTIKIGEWISENGISDLTQDNYSWHDLPYTYPHWLYDLLMFEVFDIGGWDGIYYSTVVLSIILAISLYAISCKLSKNYFVSFVVAFGAMYVLKPFVTARAQLITFILFAWTVYFIELFLEPKQNKWIRILCAVYLILIPILITNLHCAVFPFYFVLFLPYIGEYFVAVFTDLDIDKRILYLLLKIRVVFLKKEKAEKNELMKQKVKEQIKERKERRKKLRKNPYKIIVTKNHVVLLLIAIMAVAAFTGFLNPAGTGAYTYVYKTMKGNTTTMINEHLPLEFISNKEFVVSVLVFLMIMIFTDTKIKLSDLFMLVGLTYLSFKMRRQVSMFAIFCGFILAKMIASFLDKYAKDTTDKIYKTFTKFIGILIILALTASICYDIYRPIRNDPYISKSSYPVDACKWIEKNLDLTYVKFYNEYNFGSYMLYKNIPVFIDSRCDLYTPEFNGDEEKGIKGKDIFSDAINIAGFGTDYDVHFNNYGVTHVISYSNSKLCLALSSDTRYRKIYEDDYFRIYAKIDKERDVEKQLPTLSKSEKTLSDTVYLSG